MSWSSILLAEATGFGAFLVAHLWMWSRKSSSDPRIGRIMTLMAAGWIVSIAVYSFLEQLSAESFYVLTGISAGIYVLYLYFYSGICRSVSVTLLIHIDDARSKIVSFPALVSDYTSSSRFEDRIDVMRRAGFVDVNASGVELTPKGKKAAKTIRIASSIICGGLEG